jgi:anthranilate synthase component 2
MILLIDNYDSFVYNLLHYVQILGFEACVYRNDAIDIEKIQEINPSHIILSPGPCSPNESGICIPIINKLYKTIPILGVCLGHQAIGQAFSAKILRAKEPMHGKKSLIKCTEPSLLFEGVDEEFTVARYHSLIVDKESFPHNSLKITSICGDSQIMSLEHKSYPLYGVQFHPESILTQSGMQIIKNFTSICYSINNNPVCNIS